jgi:hypothetical protein
MKKCILIAGLMSTVTGHAMEEEDRFRDKRFKRVMPTSLEALKEVETKTLRADFIPSNKVKSITRLLNQLFPDIHEKEIPHDAFASLIITQKKLECTITLKRKAKSDTTL